MINVGLAQARPNSVKTMTSLPINLYHKQYMFTHKWSLLKVAQMVIVEGCHFIYYDDFSPPLKIF